MSPRHMKPNKEGDKEVVRMKERLTMSEQIFKEQIHIFENDLAFMKREADMRNEQIARRADENRVLQRENATLKGQFQQVVREK